MAAVIRSAACTTCHAAKFGPDPERRQEPEQLRQADPRDSDFFSISVASQFVAGTGVGGSVDTGRTVDDNCFVVDSPQQLLNCHAVTPFKAQTLVKGTRQLPVPGQLRRQRGHPERLGDLLRRELHGAERRDRAVTRPQSRGVRDAGGLHATATVPLIPLQTMFDPRRTQLDLRLSKVFTVGTQNEVARQSRRLQRDQRRRGAVCEQHLRSGVAKTRWDRPYRGVDSSTVV